MNSVAVWAVGAALALAALGFVLLWRRAVGHLRAREQLWRNALRALAARDYEGARTLAAMMDGAPAPAAASASSFLSTSGEGADANTDGAVVLRQTADALRQGANEQERARRDLEDVLASLQDAVLVVDGESRLRFLNGAALSLFGVRVEDVLGAGLLEALPSFGLEAAVRAALHEGTSTAREVSLYTPGARRLNARTDARGDARPASEASGATDNGRPQNARPDSARHVDGRLSDTLLNDRRLSDTLLNDRRLNDAPFSDGRREVFLRVAPVRRGGGGTSGAVAILQDLTEMRRLERVRRDFVANASHELRTPVANIRAGAETILSEPGDAALAARFLPHIVTEAERLSRLVTDLLDLARAESPAEAPRAPVDVCHLAASVVQRLGDKAAQNDLVLRFVCHAARAGTHHAGAHHAGRDSERDIEAEAEAEADDGCSRATPEHGAWVLGDGAGLEQVVFNLLDNALMYTPASGRIEVEVRTDPPADALPADVSPSDKNGEPPRHSVIVAVSDSGIGIPQADLERIFERFYRVDKARSRTQGGTGLGLAIVKHIVENHGGHVAVQSQVGQGTTFTVTLPAAS